MPQFNKIAREHGFKEANKSGTRVKDLTAKANTPLAGVTSTPTQGDTYKMRDTMQGTSGQSAPNKTRHTCRKH